MCLNSPIEDFPSQEGTLRRYASSKLRPILSVTGSPDLSTSLYNALNLLVTVVQPDFRNTIVHFFRHAEKVARRTVSF